VAWGLYVPAETDSDVVEQRIVEAAARLPAHSAVSAWASLRWRGATFFDGLGDGGRTRLPVPLLVGGNIRPDPRVVVSHEQLPPSEIEWVAGVPVTIVERAVFDEMRRTGSVRRAVEVIDMAIAAELTDLERVAEYIAIRPAWTGVPMTRLALPLASADSRSPQETRMRLTWVLNAGLPTPVCNQPVFDLDGRLLGIPDLFDPVAGLVGEYDGADHLAEDRRARDAVREERFRDHGLEYVALVRGDLGRPAQAAHRILAARARAKFLAADDRRWTLDPPSWWRPVG
jgi:hypothetical protein